MPFKTDPMLAAVLNAVCSFYAAVRLRRVPLCSVDCMLIHIDGQDLRTVQFRKAARNTCKYFNE
jgi:hypothetical protein